MLPQPLLSGSWRPWGSFSLPCRRLAKESPRAWQPETSTFLFKVSVSPLPPPLSSPPTPKKGGCPCVEYTACNFAVKPQLGGQCCDWLCKDLSLKGNYTKFPLKDSSLWIEYKKTPTSHPCSWKCFGLCGWHWHSGDTLRHSDSSEERLQGDKTQGQGKRDQIGGLPESSVWEAGVLGSPEGEWVSLLQLTLNSLNQEI